jgi:hypothetical protein
MIATPDRANDMIPSMQHETLVNSQKLYMLGHTNSHKCKLLPQWDPMHWSWIYPKGRTHRLVLIALPIALLDTAKQKAFSTKNHTVNTVFRE